MTLRVAFPRPAAAAALLLLSVASELAAQASLPTVDQQVAAAVLALPKEMRDGAMVMGYRTPGKLEMIRPGTNSMICLAQFAVEPGFHVSCYHKGMEPFMARGRALRAEGVKGDQVDSVRFREVRKGTLVMPRSAVLYQLFGPKTAWDPATGKVTDAKSLMVMYMPGATAESTGLSPVPVQTGPWIMFPGTPKAHLMMSGSMTP